MHSCQLVTALRKEIKTLEALVAELEDKSALCFPQEYTCDECLHDVIGRLKKIKTGAAKSLKWC